LNLRKWYAIITNVEADHLDYYRDLEDIKGAFDDFLYATDDRGFAVVNGDDPNLIEIVSDTAGLNIHTVGYGEENQYRIGELENRNGYYSFQMVGRDGEALFQARLSVPGRFNCINAALSAALALNLGISGDTIQESLSTFLGTGRRLEYLGTRGMQHLYTDYAHHPTEIALALSTLREVHAGMELCVVFQPHQYSRTAKLFDGFVDSLLGADCVILTDIYRQRDSEVYVKAVSSQDLMREMRKRGRNRRIALVRDDEELFSLLSEQNLPSEESGTVVAFLGAGDIDEAARRYAALPG
jgi:UDP-N-acetylmuramate--alanine ligase